MVTIYHYYPKCPPGGKWGLMGPNLSRIQQKDGPNTVTFWRNFLEPFLIVHKYFAPSIAARGHSNEETPTCSDSYKRLRRF
jgi:hypothetical protein